MKSAVDELSMKGRASEKLGIRTRFWIVSE